MDPLENIRKTMDDINEQIYGMRPFGTKKEIDYSKTLEELAFSELFGQPVKVKRSES